VPDSANGAGDPRIRERVCPHPAAKTRFARKAGRLLTLREHWPFWPAVTLSLWTRTTHPNGIVCHFRIV
jgi:hypothetical protein